MEQLTGLFGALAIAFLAVLAVLWFLVPLAVFACMKHLSVIRRYLKMIVMSAAEEGQRPPPPQAKLTDQGQVRKPTRRRRSLVDVIWPH